MLAIGRALMAEPTVLLLDEPSMGLAPILVEQIFDIVREINEQGTTVLLVEQNALMALNVAKRGYILQTGEIVLTGDAAEARAPILPSARPTSGRTDPEAAMAEVPRVPLGRPPAGSWLPRVAWVSLIVVVLVIAKPWAPTHPRGPGHAGADLLHRPVATERTGPRPYDPRLFGGRRAGSGVGAVAGGYVVQFGMAGPLQVDEQGGSPLPSGEPTAPPSGGRRRPHRRPHRRRHRSCRASSTSARRTTSSRSA